MQAVIKDEVLYLYDFPFQQIIKDGGAENANIQRGNKGYLITRIFLFFYHINNFYVSSLKFKFFKI
jgi:hypothetical protein